MNEDKKEDLYSFASQLYTLLDDLEIYNAKEECGSLPTEIKTSVKNAIDFLNNAAGALFDATEGLDYLEYEKEQEGIE